MDAIFFDLDGTLWDSTKEVEKAWNEILGKKGMGLIKESDLRKEFGKPIEEIMENLFSEVEEGERKVLTEELLSHQNKKMEEGDCFFYPGMKEVLISLSASYPLCIISNCQSGYIEAFLKNAQLTPYILDYTCPGDTGMLKGKNIQYMMKKHGFQRVVYVGDTEGDEQACKEAGVPMIFAAYGFGEVKEKHPQILELSQLKDAIEELGK